MNNLECGERSDPKGTRPHISEPEKLVTVGLEKKKKKKASKSFNI